jgi:hypothetical protein
LKIVIQKGDFLSNSIDSIKEKHNIIKTILNDQLEVTNKPITRSRAKKLKDAFKGLI